MTTGMTTADSSPATAPISVPVTETNPTASELAKVEVAALITGRTLRFPIYDNAGVLLLAEGQVITSKFKELLRTRNIDSIQVNREEVSSIALLSDAANLARAETFDTEITKKLDSIIESGALFVSNEGVAVRESLLTHGTEPYDSEERKEFIEQHKKVCAELSSMMQDALHGKKLEGEKLLGATAMYVSSLTSDVDNALTAAQEVGRDATLSHHCMQTSLLAMAIGIEMQLNAENTRMLGLCGLVHDWGMIRVPESIRHTERRLTASEFEEVKKHPLYVLEMLGTAANIPSLVSLICYQVHERPNGTGYPRERQKGSIHPFARILHVADQYVALTSPRPYRKPLMPYAAMECLLRQAKHMAVDPRAVRVLLQVNSLFPIGSFVALNDGSVARVLRRNGNAYATPIVQVVQSPRGEFLTENAPILDLSRESLRVIQALPTPGRGEIGMSDDLLQVASEQ